MTNNNIVNNNCGWDKIDNNKLLHDIIGTITEHDDESD